MAEYWKKEAQGQGQDLATLAHMVRLCRMPMAFKRQNDKQTYKPEFVEKPFQGLFADWEICGRQDTSGKGKGMLWEGGMERIGAVAVREKAANPPIAPLHKGSIKSLFGKTVSHAPA